MLCVLRCLISSPVDLGGRGAKSAAGSGEVVCSDLGRQLRLPGVDASLYNPDEARHKTLLFSF
jgi:hypothetical protein